MLNKEINIHIWCKPPTADVTALYTLSVSGKGLSYNLPLDATLDTLREYLDEMPVAKERVS